MEATTRSMIRKGMKSRKPISKAPPQFGNHEGRSHDPERCGFRAFRQGLFRHFDEQGQIILAGVGEHEGLQRRRGTVEGLGELDLLFQQGLDPFVIGLGEDRRHDEAGQEDGQRDQDGVRRTLLQAQTGAQQGQHDDDPHETRRHDDDRRGQGEYGEQGDQLQDALGQLALCAGIDGDALRVGHAGPGQRGAGPEGREPHRSRSPSS